MQAIQVDRAQDTPIRIAEHEYRPPAPPWCDESDLAVRCGVRFEAGRASL